MLSGETIFAWWNVRLPSAGALALAAFWLALISGVALIVPYDPAAAADSLQLVLITNPAGIFFRAVHYWSGQLFVLLSAMHLVEHLVRKSDRRVRTGVWLRLVASLPVGGYLMVSGYVLKGDGEGEMARQVLSGLLSRLPLLGPPGESFLLGAESDLHVIYLQHAATATAVTLVLTLEHARRLWPPALAWLLVLVISSGLALVLPPGLHDPANPVAKGPWYMLGVQELLHWLPAPELLWVLGGLWLLTLAVLPWLRGRWGRRARSGWLLSLALYGGLVMVGAWLRGPNWAWQWPWEKAAGTGAIYLPPAVYLPGAAVAEAEIPVVLGRREGCLPCHRDLPGFAPAHDPSAIGCASCHLGNPWTGNAGAAHRGMVLVAGNLDRAGATCGAADCHGEIVERVRSSLMATGRGMVAVDRFVFGEAPTPDGDAGFAQLGDSPADAHLRQLCATCHLGHVKEHPGPVDELSRGGGCTACHLNYPAEEKSHPSLDLRVGDEHCFGCHSRSGRISSNYEGWHETALAAAPAGDPDHRVLADGRVLSRQSPDLHHEAGMSCIDCHTAREAMGDGTAWRHEEEQVEIACPDCHLTAARTVAWEELDAESRAILRLRHGEELEGWSFLVAGRTGRPLVNVLLGPDGRPVLEGKLSGKRHRLLPPAAGCRLGLPGHERLSCRSCHTAWAPQCLGCHTQQTPGGQWVELAGTFLAEPPTLGVRGAGDGGRIVPFIPGMIMTLNPEPAAVSPGAAPLLRSRGSFHRLFAPTAAHTTRREGRSCRSCHLDPLALGLGRGELTFGPEATPRWSFDPAYEALRDGLPADAWTSRSGTRQEPAATRSDARPFSPDEQERIVRVGACLTCHEPAAGIYEDFARAVDNLRQPCRVSPPTATWRRSAIFRVPHL